MYNFKAVTERAAFKLWFVRQLDDTFQVFEVDSNKLIGTYNSRTGLYRPFDGGKPIEAAEVSKLIDLKEVKEQFDQFEAGRPEYHLGRPWEEISLDPKVAYDTLLTAVILARAYRKNQSVDKCMYTAHRCLDWLETTDFYTAPGSTVYHDSYPEGLIRHTLRVYDLAIQLRKSVPMFQLQELDSVALIALVHDWCKIGLYEKYMKNVKDDNDKWIQQPAYRHTAEVVPLGHGVASLFFAASFFKLSEDEACALRWHMGAWRVTPSEQNDLQEANERYPMVHLIQFADQLSIVRYI